MINDDSSSAINFNPLFWVYVHAIFQSLYCQNLADFRIQTLVSIQKRSLRKNIQIYKQKVRAHASFKMPVVKEH